VEDVRARLLAFERVHCIAREVREGDVRLIGTSGTVTTLAGVVLALQRYRRPLVDGVALTAEAALQAVADLRELGREALARHPCVGPDRVDFVLPGCAVFVALARLWPVNRVTVADRGLREGMLTRLIQADRVHARHRARP
jgi:exopolyphosphatase/guanosine-5'-triphosphate,3'-diphosphate pyrophosphatase